MLLKKEEILLPRLERLRTIEVLLNEYGFVNRKVLANIFGIGIAQASSEVSALNALSRDRVTYNRVTRRIEMLANGGPTNSSVNNVGG